MALGDPVIDYVKVLWDPAAHDFAFDWRDLGLQPADDGFADRMDFHARATLLEEVIDGLADYVEINATDPALAPIKRDKRYKALEESLPLYRERYL